MWEGVGMRTEGREGWMVKKGGERKGGIEGRSEGRRVGGTKRGKEVRREGRWEPERSFIQITWGVSGDKYL